MSMCLKLHVFQSGLTHYDRDLLIYLCIILLSYIKTFL